MIELPSAGRLAAIVAPFGRIGSRVALAIEDADGRTLAAAGPERSGRAPAVIAEIRVGGTLVGRTVARGPGARGRLAEAAVTAVAAGIAALVEESVARRTAAQQVPAAIEAELALARRIQRSFAPLIPPDLVGFEIGNHYEAAHEVGGDFFDAFRVRGRTSRLAIVIADVTGKGIAAALLMSFARPLLHAAIDHVTSPGEALERTNRILVEERRSALFITGMCAFVDLRTARVRIANAGHEPPLLVPAGTTPATWLEASGPLLGAFPRLDLEECVTVLGPGDLVLFYTDGVTDTKASNGERFGDARLLEAVDGMRGRSAQEVVGAIAATARAFQGDMPAADDVTLVAIRRLEGPTDA